MWPSIWCWTSLSVLSWVKDCSLLWCHNGHDSVSNHLPHDCLLTGLCAGNLPWTSEFPAQMASNAENVSIWWRHHVPNWHQSITSINVDILWIGPSGTNFNDMRYFLYKNAFESWYLRILLTIIILGNGFSWNRQQIRWDYKIRWLCDHLIFCNGNSYTDKITFLYLDNFQYFINKIHPKN